MITSIKNSKNYFIAALSSVLLCACASDGPKEPNQNQPARVPNNQEKAARLRNPNSGKRFSIFSGDPARIQKANEVNLADFKGAVEMKPQQASISAIAKDPANNKIEMFFCINNIGKRSYTLSFPDSQRFDYALRKPDGTLLYKWSQDKEFVQVIGSSFLNGGERIIFSDVLPLPKLLSMLQPGSYTITAELSNYPEITASASFSLNP